MDPSLLDWLWKAGIGFLIALIWYVLKDRKKQKLEEELAEETQQPRIRKAGIEALESQILAMAKAWDEERLSKDRRIEELKQGNDECREKIEAHEDTIARQGLVIAEMHEQAIKMQSELDAFKAQLEKMTNIVADPQEDSV